MLGSFDGNWCPYASTEQPSISMPWNITASCTGAPKVPGWSIRNEQLSGLRTVASDCTSTYKCCHAASTDCPAAGPAGHDAQPFCNSSDADECPSLKVSCLAFLAPYVHLICTASEQSLQLPSHIKANLLGLARRRGDLTDAAVLALVDKSFAHLALNGCSHLRPSTLSKALQNTCMLQKLDLSKCQLINSVVYSLPCSVPHLIVLRLNGVDVSGVDFSAWKKLIPALIVGRTPDSWEEHSGAEQPRGLGQLRWMLWEDVPAAVHQLYLRRWPKLQLNAHLASPSSPGRRHQDVLPNDAIPEATLDWDGFGTVPDSAWRTLATEGCQGKQGRSHDKRRGIMDEMDEEEEDEEVGVRKGESGQPMSALCSALAQTGIEPLPHRNSNRSQDVLQRWLDSEFL